MKFFLIIVPVEDTFPVVLPVPLLFSPDPPSADESLNRLSCPALLTASAAAAAASLACCCAFSSLSISSLSSRSLTLN